MRKTRIGRTAKVEDQIGSRRTLKFNSNETYHVLQRKSN